MNSRDMILDGKIEIPHQIFDLVGTEYQDLMEQMFQSIWYNYLKNKGSVSSVYWYDRFDNPVVFNKFITHLSRAGWIVSTVEPKRNWAEIQFNESKLDKWVTPKEVLQMRETSKFLKYKLNDQYSTDDDKVKTAQGIKSTGLVRKGFAKASAVPFKYDTDMIIKYRDSVEMNLTKSIRLLGLEYGIFNDGVDYESISKSILKFHIDNPDKVFCLGGNVSDSRGRAIHKALGKVFNPISCKDARALLITETQPLTDEGRDNCFLAIAELLGYKAKTVGQKLGLGKRAYKLRTLPKVDLTTDEGRKDLYELIWIERIYAGLDNPEEFNVFIEVDATASMLGIQGVLLDHEPFLDMTNIVGNELKDAWNFPGIPRNQFKKAMTPLLYGSSKDCRSLWKQANIEYTLDQVRAFNKEINCGPLSVADKFKSFIIDNVKPKEKMTVQIWNERFDIVCNRYRNVGEYSKRYDIYSTEENRVESIYHTHTKKVPDLQQFKRFFVTLLCHNLDSQIADEICLEVEGILPIHDAFLSHPNQTNEVKQVFCDVLREIYRNRDVILSNYFDSIGIDSKASVDWSKLQSHVKPLNEEFVPQHSALK